MLMSRSVVVDKRPEASAVEATVCPGEEQRKLAPAKEKCTGTLSIVKRSCGPSRMRRATAMVVVVVVVWP